MYFDAIYFDEIFVNFYKSIQTFTCRTGSTFTCRRQKRERVLLCKYDAQVKDHEAPYGKYANGIIVETYHSGEIIPVSIQITANHKGKFYFHLCPNDNIHQDPTEDCFETTPLSIYPSGESTYVLPDQMSRTYTFQLKLPKDLTCQQCILRWTYRTGNHWGYEKGNPKGCLGCGPQEFFKACSDIRIIKG